MLIERVKKVIKSFAGQIFNFFINKTRYKADYER
jgi:hypothetical protein